MAGERRISALDGWRGIAILLVLIDHIVSRMNIMPVRIDNAHIGQHGVTIFFVLSGYLITSKLVEAPINLKRFYIRRLFRLTPVEWLFLSVLVFLRWHTGFPITTWSEIAGCVFFYRNYLGGNTGAAHFWSLSIESQFYLVWPSVCCLLVASVARGSRGVALSQSRCGASSVSREQVRSQTSSVPSYRLMLSCVVVCWLCCSLMSV